MELNKGQEKVFGQLQEFIAGDDQFFSLEAGGGRGKTYLLNFLESKIPELNKVRKLMQLPLIGKMIYTATTNKAASLLGRGTTVHKQFKIRPYTNFKTGVTTYNTGDTPNLYEEILVLDESSMLDPQILTIIEKKIKGRAKVIFALDPYQLAPIGHEKPIVDTLDIPRGTLTQPMRQEEDSHLFKMCEELREAVRIQTYFPLVQGEGIRFVDGNQFQQEYLTAFRNHENVRIIANSNDQVEAHNTFVRKKLYGVDTFQEGDPVVAASGMGNCPDIRVEETYQIHSISEPVKDKYLDYYNVDLGLSQMFRVPVNKAKFFSKLRATSKEAKQSGDWTEHYSLKENYLDIRDAFACTAHKSQGSTYDKVFLDFANLAKCPNLNTFLRALYVAVSRAKTEVIIYGL